MPCFQSAMSVASTLSDSAPLQGPMGGGGKNRNLRKVTTGPTVLRNLTTLSQNLVLIVFIHGACLVPRVRQISPYLRRPTFDWCLIGSQTSSAATVSQHHLNSLRRLSSPNLRQLISAPHFRRALKLWRLAAIGQTGPCSYCICMTPLRFLALSML